MRSSAVSPIWNLAGVGASGRAEALLGVGGLHGVFVLGEGADRVDHSPADQAVVARGGAFGGLFDLGDDLRWAVQSGCLALISAATPAT